MQTAEKLWQYVWDALFCETTGLFYDLRTHTGEDGNITDLPAPKEIRRIFPNACGWHTGMENSMINAGLMLDVVIRRYEKTRETQLCDLAEKIFDGILLCSNVSGIEGFLARSVSPANRKSYYPDSSRDQYTHVIFSLIKYYDSPLCTRRREVRDVLVAFAKRAEQNVTAENGYNYLRADGKKGIACGMWGDLGGHEYCRLPMIYAAAHYVSGEQHWLAAYRSVREEALKKTFVIRKDHGYYAVMQMQLALHILYRLDAEYRDRYAVLMREAADRYTRVILSLSEKAAARGMRFDHLPSPWRSVPLSAKQEIDGTKYPVPVHNKEFAEETALLTDAGDVMLIGALCPGFEIPAACKDALQDLIGRIDISRHGSEAPFHLLAASQNIL